VFPSSDIRILDRTGDRLVVLDAPFFMAGVLILSVVALGVALPFAFRGYARWNVLFGATLASAFPIAVLGLVMLTSLARITFDASTDHIWIVREIFWIARTQAGPPLHEVSSVTVVTGTGSRKHLHCLCLVLESGQTVSLGSYTSQSGHYAVAEAINDFLAQRRKRLQ
jgi:hypothetical protein